MHRVEHALPLRWVEAGRNEYELRPFRPQATVFVSQLELMSDLEGKECQLAFTIAPETGQLAGFHRRCGVCLHRHDDLCPPPLPPKLQHDHDLPAAELAFDERASPKVITLDELGVIEHFGEVRQKTPFRAAGCQQPHAYHQEEQQAGCDHRAFEMGATTIVRNRGQVVNRQKRILTTVL
jgi:hypothetical protein